MSPFTLSERGGERVSECYIIFRGGGSPELLYNVIWGGEGAKKVTVCALYNM